MANQKIAFHKEVAVIFHDVWPLQEDNIRQQSGVTSTDNVASFQSKPLTLDHCHESVSENPLTDILHTEDTIQPFNQKESAQSASNETAAQRASEIPKFDLAEQIMAQHRKNTSAKRIAPKAIDQKAQTIDLGPETSSELKGVRNVIEDAKSVLRKRQYTRHPK
jgi:hypothetical protein